MKVRGARPVMGFIYDLGRFFERWIFPEQPFHHICKDGLAVETEDGPKCGQCDEQRRAKT
jgi:hypothetical protein